MGICIYCGQKAGMFKDHHKECAEKRVSDILNGKAEIETAVLNAIVEKSDLNELSILLDSITERSFITDSDKQENIFKGYDSAVSLFMSDNILDSEEETKLVIFQNHFNYTAEQLNKNRSYDIISKSSIIRRLNEGGEFEYGDGKMELPVILEKNEKLIWVFIKSNLYQPTTKTTFVGRSQGVSVRVMSGVYYRMGAYSGEPTTSTDIKLLASGLTLLTSKNIFFCSALKTVKIPFNKIISI